MRVRTHAQFITQSMVVHNGKYEYLSDYTRTDALIDIRCPKHGVFQQTPHQHLRGAGCRSCADEYRASLHRKNPDKYVAECNIIHNGKYTYDMTTYINTHSNVRIICPLHGEFQQMALHHWHGSECPTCAIGSNVSKQETDWLDSLNINKEYRNPKLYINDKLIKPDAYIPETNTIYEFYGDYWHGNPNVFDLTATNEMAKKTFQELYSATMERAQLIKNAGYNLICIWECEWEAMCKSA
jgi:G:T-mismatch repair DNA endonuclease (very short patch repair protein)